METIETLSQEYSQKVGLDENEEFIYLQGLKAGAEFAQKWISPRDEMPPVGELVQVKVKWRDDHNISYDHDKRTVCNGYDDFEINQMAGLEVVGWRPINLK